MKINEIHTNKDNPKFIRDERFEKLKKSIEEFPKMMKLRPIIVDNAGMILGGNMRYKALVELGYKEIPDEWVKRAEELTEEERKRFVIVDNIGFGQWDWDLLANEWDEIELEEWGLELPTEWKLREPTGDDLIGDLKDKPPTMKITFESPEQLQKAEIDIQELIDRKYQGAYFSISAGEI